MNNIRKTHILISLVFTGILMVFIAVGAFFIQYQKYTSERTHFGEKHSEYNRTVSQNIDELQTFFSSGQELLWDEKPDEIVAGSQSGTAIIDAIFGDVFDVIEKIETQYIVRSIPVLTQYEFPILSHDFLYISGGNVNFTNMSNYQYKYFEKYISSEQELFYDSEPGVYIGKVQLGDDEYIIYYKQVTYSYENLITDVQKYSVYLAVLFFIIFCFVFFSLAIILKPLSKNYNAMDEFINNAGHELKTPLASIMSSIGILKRTQKYDEGVISDVISETQRSNTMIETLRDISRIESTSDIKKILVGEKIQEIKKILEVDIRKKNIYCSILIKDNFEVQADENHFFICVSNIMKNAIKYNKEGGKIHIVVHKGKLKITDTGIGMKKSEIKKIFDRFYRSKLHRDGTGLGVGLFLVQKIAKIYNWKISVESEQGKGTSFLIEFY